MFCIKTSIFCESWLPFYHIPQNEKSYPWYNLLINAMEKIRRWKNTFEFCVYTLHEKKHASWNMSNVFFLKFTDNITWHLMHIQQNILISLDLNRIIQMTTSVCKNSDYVFDISTYEYSQTIKFIKRSILFIIFFKKGHLLAKIKNVWFSNGCKSIKFKVS